MPDHFRPLDRDTLLLLPPSLQDWLPEDHLARFVVDVIAKLDMEPIRSRYSGRGSAAYQPEMMIALLLYGYATGVFSSRRLERATYDSVAFRFITADQHPEHDTISDFRKRFLPQVKGFFEQLLLVASEAGLLKVGRVSVDGTKIKANASKNHALSYAYAKRLKVRLKREVDQLMKLAEKADKDDLPDGLDIPKELTRRHERLATIDQALSEIRSREQERIGTEQVAHQAKMSERRAKERKRGAPFRRAKPKAPSRKIRPEAQVNLTDSESRIMPSSGGFVQAYNAQAAIDTESRLMVSTFVSQAPVDANLLGPTIESLKALPEQTGHVTELLADAGYFSAANVEKTINAGLTPYIAPSRDRHYEGLGRFAEPPNLAPGADSVEKMRHRLKTQAGRKIYAVRKSTIEPSFGIIKSALGFRQFLLRGKTKVGAEWSLVCMGYNLKRMHRLTATSYVKWVNAG
jgi:transposase